MINQQRMACSITDGPLAPDEDAGMDEDERVFAEEIERRVTEDTLDALREITRLQIELIPTGEYRVINPDTYDGEGSTVGRGDSPEAAVEDYREQEGET